MLFSFGFHFLQIPDSRFQTPDSRLQIPDSKTPDSRVQTPDSRLQIPDSKTPRLQILDSRLRIPDSRFQTPASRLQILDSKCLGFHAAVIFLQMRITLLVWCCDVQCVGLWYKFWLKCGPVGLREWFKTTPHVRRIHFGRVWARTEPEQPVS